MYVQWRICYSIQPPNKSVGIGSNLARNLSLERDDGFDLTELNKKSVRYLEVMLTAMRNIYEVSHPHFSLLAFTEFLRIEPRLARSSLVQAVLFQSG
jgi:hypothetical protein